MSQECEGQFDSSDREIAKLIALAQCSDAIYSIQPVHGLVLAYRHLKPKVDQLVIPWSCEFCYLLL